jgi:hypothetical protein
MITHNAAIQESIAAPTTPGKFGEPDTRTGAGATAKIFAPTHSIRGVDAAGAIHHWDSRANRLYVVREERLEHVEDLQGRDIQEWEAFVAQQRGWSE